MELGEKLRAARLEAGLSQRQLCGGEITRNMLSQIEHGTARPSMDTLRYLAARLEKPVSYFLEEENAVSPNRTLMAEARRLLDGGQAANALTVLEGYRNPDPLFDREKQLLECLLLLMLAEEAVQRGQDAYARALLERLTLPEGGYRLPSLEKRKLLVAARVEKQTLRNLQQLLPPLDEELLLRAESALMCGDGEQAARLLEAAQDRQSPHWKLLRGRACMLQKKYRPAISCLLEAEAAFPEETAPLLETCYRETDNFRRAYYYACKQKK